MTDEQCLQCAGVFSCKDCFKKEDNCERFTRGWGTCRKCSRIVSPNHSNCPKCGSREIKPTCEELILKEMEREKKCLKP